MAFIFVPNADGSFDEGDRQTNLDTGVEYVFTDGAWRPLGPKIEDQFPELDERYVNIDGDVMHGTLKFDHGADTEANILIRPNISNVSTSIYQLNGGALRLRSLPGEDINDGSTSHIAIGKNETTGEPETYVYHLQDPAGPQHGVNLQYLEKYVADELENIDLSEYLPLTGGDMTGAINIDRPSSQAIIISKEGQENLKLWVDGTVTTTKTTFSDDNFVTKAYVDSNTSTDSMNINGENTVTTNWVVRGSGRTFMQNSSNELGLYRLKAPSESHHAARKQDVDNHKAKARTGTSTSPTLTTGELYYNTSTKQLFIGE
jgi:hypothetical protein